MGTGGTAGQPIHSPPGEGTDAQMYVKRQDDTLGVISGTLSTLVSQAGLIGQEVGEQSEYVSFF